MKVSVARAKLKLSDLLKAVERGETVTICRRGVPIASLVRAEVQAPKTRRKPKFGTMRDKFIIHDEYWWKPMELVYSHELEALKRSRRK